jgi:signal transduction histidine kinase
VFEAVIDELVQWLHADNAGMLRYEGEGTATVLATRTKPGIDSLPVGTRVTLEGDNIPAMVLKTGLPARQDSLEDTASSFNESIREVGVQSGIGVPVIMDGRVWGVIGAASSRPKPLPPDTEMLIGDFADLVGTAIANAATRDQLRDLAEQQAALRRVATLVAQGVSPPEVFAAVANETARCLDASNVGVMRVDGDTLTILALAQVDRGMQPAPVVGERLTVEGDNVAAMVLRTGRAARIDSPSNATGSIAERVAGLGLTSLAAIPIIVGGRIWGLIGVASPDLLPADTEKRMGDFADLVATAIANAATRDELIASRARIVAAADDARRRIERDLHDGAQQRLVSLGLQLRLAESSVPPELQSLKELMSGVVSGLTAVSSDLQEISRGIHPAILSEGGLAPALKTLARRCPVPADIDVLVEQRLPDSVEVAAYYVVAEALTNAAKYAQASKVNVCAEVKDGDLRVSIQDDGIGGADSRKGSGLIGLKDRVEVLGGHMKVISPPGSGTSLHVTIPLPAE